MKSSVDRRRFLRGVGTLTTAGAFAGCTGGGSGGDSTGGGDGDGETTAPETAEPTATPTDTATATPAGTDAAAGGTATGAVADYLSDVGNFDGSVSDMTGKDEVIVEVGSRGNGGYFAFYPVAVRVSPGTTVVWEWTGEGGAHNVVAEEGTYESELTDEGGFTFSQTFPSSGDSLYYCEPHRSLGMKGAVVVE
ncbi:halocyanin domain-containing protein [Halobacteriales archaeon QS_1_68_17]|nr:MAG: halocyanin domain-containing protein [Halobacteriales archaeon QS_1_68_17]